MNFNQSYEVYTLELGPFSDLDDLHREVSNHAETFATEVYAREAEILVSISHSIVGVRGDYIASVIITTRSDNNTELQQ